MTYTISYKLELRKKNSGYRICQEIQEQLLNCKNFLELRKVSNEYNETLTLFNKDGIYPDNIRERGEMYKARNVHDQIKVEPKLTKCYIKIKVIK